MEAPSTHPVIHVDLDEKSDNEEDWDAQIRFDSNKPCWRLEDDEEKSDPDEDEPDNNEIGVEADVLEAGDEDWRNEGLHVSMMVLAIDNGDDPQDEDWIPDKLRKKIKKRLARGMSKQ